MKDTEESKATIELGMSKIDSHTFYIGRLGIRIHDEKSGQSNFTSSSSAYAENFDGYIFLAGFTPTPKTVFDYTDVCELFAKTVGQDMKRYGITAYEFETGNPDTGMIFDEKIKLFAYFHGVGASMDPIPDDGIELFKKTLEDYLK